MKRPLLPNFRAFLIAISKRTCQKPPYGYSLCRDLSGPYRAMRGAMRCERRCVLNTKWRCDAMQKSWRCAFSLRKSSAMRSHDAKTLAMRCRDAGHSGRDSCVEKDATPYRSLRALRARSPPRSARESVPEKRGDTRCAWECLSEGSRDPLSPGPKCVQKVTQKCLKRHFFDTFQSLLEGPQGHFSRHFRAHPDFWRHSLGHS